MNDNKILLQIEIDKAKNGGQVSHHIELPAQSGNSASSAAPNDQWGKTASFVMKNIQLIKKMISSVSAIDAAMLELGKASNATGAQMSQSFQQSAQTAKQYAMAIDEVIRTTAGFSRSGYNLSDSQELAKIAAIYKNISSGMTLDSASASLADTLSGFQMTADEAMHVIDALNEVADNYTLDSAGIGEALQRSASSMHAAGNTLEETVGLIAAARTATQDADAIGTAYQTISMRLQGASAKLTQLGLETAGMAESPSALREEMLSLSGVDIMTDNDTFKSTYQILDELAAKWQNLTAIQQASLTELIAGKEQDGIVSALMTNFDTARQAAETAVNSTGSALKEQEAYEKGIQYSLDRLEASFQTFTNHILDSAFLKGIVDFGNGAVNVLDAVTDKLGSFGTIGLGAGLFAGIKNVGRDKMYSLSNFCFAYADNNMCSLGY